MPDNDRFLDRLNRWQSRVLRAWAIWAAIYAAGFAVLWAAGPAASWPYYAWAIGWVLVKALWDRREAAHLLRDTARRDNDS